MIRPRSVVAAFFASAAAGAGVVGVALALALMAQAILVDAVRPDELPYALGILGVFTGYAFISAFIVFCVGLALFGLPAWFILHRMGRRSRIDAAVAGGVLSFIPPMALAIAVGGLDDPSTPISGLILAGAGAVAGLIFHRTAYGAAAEP